MKTIKQIGLLVLLGCFTPLFSQNVSTISVPFSGSGGVLVDHSGNVLIANYGDALNNANGTKIRKIDNQGNLSIYAQGFQGASGNTLMPNGNIYQSNIAGNFISKVKPDGTVSTYSSQGLVSPVGIVADTAGILFVANCGDNTIRKITSDVSTTQYSSNAIFNCPNGITIDQEQNLYVSNFNDGNVIKITPGGSVSLFATIPGGSNGHLKYSEIYDALFVNSHGSSSIYRVTMDGNVAKLAGAGWRGNLDGPALEASFSRPNGIDFSKTGDTLYVNSSVPLSNVGVPLNPSLVRMITGISTFNGTEDETGPKAFDVFPNPIQDHASLRFNSPIGGELSIYLYDLMGGQVLLSESQNYSAGINQVEVTLPPNLDPGVYFLTLRGEEIAMNKRILIQ